MENMDIDNSIEQPEKPAPAAEAEAYVQPTLTKHKQLHELTGNSYMVGGKTGTDTI